MLPVFKVVVQLFNQRIVTISLSNNNCMQLYVIFSFDQVCLPIACALTFMGLTMNMWCLSTTLNPTLRNFGQHTVMKFMRNRVELWTSEIPFFFCFCFCNFIRKTTNTETNLYTFGNTSLHAVRVCYHLLQLDKDTNYPSYNKCAVPINLCYTHPNGCQCGGVHTHLVDYENIMIACTEHTEAGRLVSIAIDLSSSTDTYNLYALKDTYIDSYIP